MLKYKVHFLTEEEHLESVLNMYAEAGWKFNSLETEYTKYVVIFEREK